eukprot:g15.t1
MDVDDEDPGEDIPCALQQTLRGHLGPVYGLTFNRNKSYLLSASGDRSVRLWNPKTGLQIAKYEDLHRQEVFSIAVTKDSSLFYTAGSDSHSCVVDVTEGKVVRKLQGHTRRLATVKLLPGLSNDQVLLTASADQCVRLWDARSKRCAQTLSDAKDCVTDLAVLENDNAIASSIMSGAGGGGGKGNKSKTTSAGGPSTTIVPEYTFASCSLDGRIRQYDIRKGQVYVDPIADPLSCISFSNDGLCVLASTLCHKIYLLERESGEQLQQYEGHVNSDFQVQSVLDPSDGLVYSGSEDGKIFVWDLVEGGCKCRIVPDDDIMRKNNMLSLVFQNEKTLLCGGSDGKIRVFGNTGGGE